MPNEIHIIDVPAGKDRAFGNEALDDIENNHLKL